jgi:hypothetical protein
MILQALTIILEKGKLAPSWGGDVCYAHTPMSTHVIESLGWMIVSLFLWYGLNINKHLNLLYKKAESELKKTHWTLLEHMFDQLLAFIHFAMYMQIIYYKTNISSMINLIQPCHVVLLLEGVALYTDEPLGVLITVLILPTLTGTLLATLFPDTTGLDQPYEMVSYWVQHILIQIIPLYLLLRKGSLALKLFDFKTVFVGLWILSFLHFSLYEIVDISLKVNVEFMLCPTGAMIYIFSQVPKAIVDIPSYRTLMGIVVYLVGITLSYTYFCVATFFTKYIVPLIPIKVQVNNKKHK